jgi:hypothetical protein
MIDAMRSPLRVYAGTDSVPAVLHHVTLELRRADEPRMAQFWQLAGFAPVEPPEALRGRTAWFERGDTQIHLMWVDEPVAPPLGHGAVVVEDYGATLERIRAAGFEVRESTAYWGAPRSFVSLPGGHRAEVMAWPPGANSR